jgi:hypothetical protein
MLPAEAKEHAASAKPTGNLFAPESGEPGTGAFARSSLGPEPRRLDGKRARF